MEGQSPAVVEAFADTPPLDVQEQLKEVEVNDEVQVDEAVVEEVIEAIPKDAVAAKAAKDRGNSYYKSGI
jgi:hypothetical protein